LRWLNLVEKKVKENLHDLWVKKDFLEYKQK
jgi:hypothetical protein